MGSKPFSLSVDKSKYSLVGTIMFLTLNTYSTKIYCNERGRPTKGSANFGRLPK